jgi:hypothetical protein
VGPLFGDVGGCIAVGLRTVWHFIARMPSGSRAVR